MLSIPLKNILLGGRKQLWTFAARSKHLHTVFAVWEAEYWNTPRTADTDVIVLRNLLCLFSTDFNHMGVCELQHQYAISRDILGLHVNESEFGFCRIV